MKTLVIGAAIVDIMMNIERLPKSGEDVTCTATKAVIGGCAYNVARTLSNMNCEVELCVPVGTGMYGSLVEEQLKKDGYRVLIKDKTKDNGYCLSLVEDDGERSFITVKGLEGCFQAEWFDGIDLTEYESVYLAGYQVCGESGRVIGNWLKSQKKKLQNKNLYFAPGPVIRDIDEDVMANLMSLNPILHLNHTEAAELTGKENPAECAEVIFARNHNLVIITLGAEGVLYFDGTSVHTVPSCKTKVADTIGAGDSHIAAVIGCMAKGMTTLDSISYANKVAAKIVAIEGPTMEKNEFEERMKEDIGGHNE